jgi:hypothetical protein
MLAFTLERCLKCPSQALKPLLDLRPYACRVVTPLSTRYAVSHPNLTTSFHPMGTSCVGECKRACSTHLEDRDCAVLRNNIWTDCHDIMPKQR